MEAVLQAMTTTSGSASRDEARHHRLDPGDKRRLAKPAVGKGRVVGGVDDLDIRPEPPDLGQHREAAKPRIEDERARRATPSSAPKSATTPQARLATLIARLIHLRTPYANRAPAAK